MLKYRKLLLVTLVFMLALSLLVSGCGQEEDKVPTNETANNAQEGDGSLERVKEAGSISFAMSGGYPPFNFYNDENQLVGFDIDVCKEVAGRLEVEFKPVTTEWSGIIPGLTSGVYDGILGSMAITADREEIVDFSVPYYYSGAQVIVREGSSFVSPEDLKGKKVGMATGTTFEKDAETLEAEIKLYKDDNLTLMELQNGGIDAVITDRVVGVNAINKGNFDFKLLGSPLRSENIAVAFRQEDDTLREAVNKILEEMHSDGTLSELSQKWLNIDITVE